MSGLYKTAPKQVLEARPISTKFAVAIGNEANAKYGDHGSQMSALIGSLTAQTIIISALVGTFEPGSADGEKALSDFYDAMKKDALERWHEPDIKRWVELQKSRKQ